MQTKSLCSLEEYPRTKTYCKNGNEVECGNGQNIAFWSHNWVFLFPLSNLIVIQDHHLIDWNFKVSNVMLNKNWNVDLLNQLLLVDGVDKILAIPIPINDVEDKLIWGPTSNGEFSVKSAHIIQIDDNQCPMFKDLLNRIRKLNIPHKVEFFFVGCW